MIRFNEYRIKKHIFGVFIGLLVGAVFFIYFQGDDIYLRFFGYREGALGAYRNAEYAFSVLYPLDYLAAEENGNSLLNVFFTKQQDPPFYLKKSSTVHVENGDRSAYIQSINDRENTRVVSTRNITIGDRIFAKQIISRPYDTASDERVTETVFNRSGKTYVIWQKYSGSIDAAYPLLLRSFRFY